MDLELQDKAAIVTGGSRGIGKAIARELAREGADVAIVARTQESLEAAARELGQETGRRIIPIVADTASDDSVRDMVRRAIEAFGHIDVLVNCAAQAGGQAPSPKLAEVTDKAFFDDMNTKVLGYLRVAREVAPYMQQQGWGRIINLGGMAARSTGAVLTSIRNVSVVALTKNLADELGPSGINVTAVHPGTTRTERNAELWAQRAQREGVSLEQLEARMAESNSIHRLIDAQDIAHVVAFLASPKSLAISGDVIGAAGGVPGRIYY
jgi:NAD(P)-dependent dehydrogenase (short-subunit alcohol dehydrogenase family)